jgi:pyruvate/2-oxoglutarate dehydrogenase complex dihydrolipoamide dehydrogenase (E3) component
VKKAHKAGHEALTLKPDLCVIGAGSAGLSLASIAASLGVSVVLIEKHRMGGERLNGGCVPSKALIAAARRAHEVRTAGRFGIDPGGERPTIDFARVRKRAQDIVASTAPMDSAERYTAIGVLVIKANARFRDPSAVEAGDKTIKARRFVIATGSRPDISAIPGLGQIPYLTDETVFALAGGPGPLVVLGAGAIGIEIAQAYRRLGIKVIVIEAGARILADEDPEMAAVIERSLRTEGVAFRIGAAFERVDPASDDHFTVRLEGGETIEGSHLVVATGRRPAVDGLDLDAAGIKADESGILVDRGLRTSNSRVYAVGDCVGGMGAIAGRFTHVANRHAGLVIRNALFRLPVRLDRTHVPRVACMDPELAAVGLSEEEARARRRAIRILRWGFSDNDRARIEETTQGHVKAIVTPKGAILGCAIAGPHAGELIMPWVMAIERGLKVSDLPGLVYPYPTLSEATRSAAVEFMKPAARDPWVRRAIGLVRRWG